MRRKYVQSEKPYLEGTQAERDSSKPASRTRRLDVSVESQRRTQIIEAARACITEEGVERLTLRKVAERARVSHPTIAYYFNTRRELIDQALLEISQDFMVGLRRRRLCYGTKDLVDLIETFLDPDRPSSRFIVQMIDAGLHDLDLRATHDEFIGYGRDRIEKSLRVGIEMGELRSDIDPVMAAALLHSLLIFWQAELVAGAITREKAIEVGRLALRLLDKSSQPNVGVEERERITSIGSDRSFPGSFGSPADMLEANLIEDPSISPEAARSLSLAFRQIYGLVTETSPERLQHS